MKRRVAALCIAAILALLSRCARTPPDTHDADVKALRDYQEGWYRSFAANDVGKLTAGFEEDGVVVLPNGGSVKGKDPTVWKRSPSSPPISLKGEVSRIEVSKSGDLAYIWGSYSLTTTDRNAGKPITTKGSYVTIYKKRDGVWKIAVDINASK